MEVKQAGVELKRNMRQQASVSKAVCEAALHSVNELANLLNRERLRNDSRSQTQHTGDWRWEDTCDDDRLMMILIRGILDAAYRY